MIALAKGWHQFSLLVRGERLFSIRTTLSVRSGKGYQKPRTLHREANDEATTAVMLLRKVAGKLQWPCTIVSRPSSTCYGV